MSVLTKYGTKVSDCVWECLETLENCSVNCYVSALGFEHSEHLILTSLSLQDVMIKQEVVCFE